MSNPYGSLPDHCFWRRAMSRQLPHLIDPVTSVGFTIEREHAVATAGSCFAQHIARGLREAGFGYMVAEAAPAGMPAAEAAACQYGVFSCRYGNIYTVRQMKQLVEEAFGRREPCDIAWRRQDGRYVDALRPMVEPAGFESPVDVASARKDHVARVRAMVETCDVFVFTLGLTEAFHSLEDGTVFPLAPGVAAGTFDADRHAFVNFALAEVQADLDALIGALKAANPTIRILLTVSPVPLIATYEQRHVLVSTVYSKSVLRIAAGDASARHALVDYFPSYEIITGPHAAGRYYEDDLREVGQAGVAHAMRTFFRHYAGGQRRAEDRAVGDRVTSELKSNSAIICDEEEIESGG